MSPFDQWEVCVPTFELAASDWSDTDARLSSRSSSDRIDVSHSGLPGAIPESAAVLTEFGEENAPSVSGSGVDSDDESDCEAEAEAEAPDADCGAKELVDVTPRMSFWINALRFYLFFWVVAWHTDRSLDTHAWQTFVPRMLNGNGQTAVAVYFTISAFFNARIAVRDAPKTSFGAFALHRLRRQLRRYCTLLLPNVVMCAVADPLISLVMGGRPAVWVRDLAKPAFWAAYMMPVYSPLSDPRLWGLGNRTVGDASWFSMALVGLDSLGAVMELALWPVLRRVPTPNRRSHRLLILTVTAILMGAVLICTQHWSIDYFLENFVERHPGGVFIKYYQTLPWAGCYFIGYALYAGRRAMVEANPDSRLRRLALRARAASGPTATAVCAVTYVIFECVTRLHFLYLPLTYFREAKTAYCSFLLVPLVFDLLPPFSPALGTAFTRLERFRMSAFLQHTFFTTSAQLPRVAQILPFASPPCIDVWSRNVWVALQTVQYFLLCAPASLVLRPFATLADDVWTMAEGRDRAHARRWVRRRLPVLLLSFVLGALIISGVLGFSDYPLPIWPSCDPSL